MGVVITLDDIRAYAEVDYIINHMNEKYIEKIPQKLLNFFSDFKDPNYEVNINPYIPLENQGLQKYALEIVALLHLKYWCEDEARKQELYNIMLKNQEKLEEQLKEKYSVEKLFDNASVTSIKDENDLEKEDFSKPKQVQRYSKYVEQNEDIQDYTDMVEEDSTLLHNDNLPFKKVEYSKSIFQKVKEKIFSLFHK